MESNGSKVIAFSPILLRKRETRDRHEIVELILFWRLAIKWLQKEDPSITESVGKRKQKGLCGSQKAGNREGWGSRQGS